MQAYTVFIQESGSNFGTTFITTVDARSTQSAKQQAKRECSRAWGPKEYPLESLHVLGIATGSVKIIEWNDRE